MKQLWIYNKWTDSLLILFPPFGAVLFVLLFRQHVQQFNDHLPLAYWVILVLLIDVAHVYSTLYRTYLDRGMLQLHRRLFVWVPLLSWVAGIAVYALDAGWFWRVLAYLAVYHFVRQQYGFMRLYSRTEVASKAGKLIDTCMIYAATLYPLLWWHTHGPRNFNWFVAGDFFYIPAAQVMPVAGVVYGIIIIAFISRTVYNWYRNGLINWPKQALVWGTAASWYLGIVYFNGDLAFTLLNVVAHGIPYMALIWMTGRQQQTCESRSSSPLLRRIFGHYGFWMFAGILILLAYLEEGIWDGFVWKEHTGFFAPFSSLPDLSESSALVWLVPLLAMPQITHYILDGFIWKRKNAAS
jgi:hypothetical protein